MAVKHQEHLSESELRGIALPAKLTAGRRGAWIVALGLALFWMLLIWAIHHQSPRTLVSFHGLIHTAIAGQFFDPGASSFPPENPFFAGQPLPYYWFFQFLGAQLVRWFGWNVFHSLEAVILVAAGALMVTGVVLGRALFRSTLAGALIGYLVVAGTNPLGFAFAGWTLATVALQSPQRLRAEPTDFLWNVVHPLYSLIRFNDFGGLYGPLLNFFLNMTSRPVALAALAVMVLCLERAVRSGRPLELVLLAGCSALATALSPISGISGSLALWFGLAGSQLLPPAATATGHASGHQASWPRLFAGLAIGAGLCLAAPTYYHLILGPSASKPTIWLPTLDGLRHLLTIVLSILALAVLAGAGWIRADRERRPFLTTLLLAALILLAGSAVLQLPASNESNLFHVAVLFLAVPAGGAILLPRSSGQTVPASTRLAAAVVLLFLPTLLLLLAAYVNRPAVPVDFGGRRPVRLPAGSDLARMYDWIETETTPESVFVLDPGRRITIAGNAAELPAMTGRGLFTEALKHYLVEPYPDAVRRVELASRLASGGAPSSADRAYLQALGRPVYVVSSPSLDSDQARAMETLYGPPAFQAADLLVFRVVP